jgi:hypothetical protein
VVQRFENWRRDRKKAAAATTVPQA